MSSSRSSSGKELRRLGLDQGEISTTQDCLGLAQSINLSIASLLSDVKELDQPVALGMKLSNVLFCGHQFLDGGLLLVSKLNKFRLEIALLGFLVCQRLAVRCTFLCRLGHHLLILLLCKLLLRLSLSHLSVEFLDEGVDHGNDTISLF